MNVADVKATLCGPVVPVVTVYNDDLSVDHAGTAENVRTIVDRGLVRGKATLLAAGAGGDFALLTIEERKAVAKTIFEASENKVPVLVGTQDANPQVVIELAQYADSLGAYGVQVGPPFYFHCSEEDCLRFYEAVHAATKKVVIMIYNTWWTGYNMSLPHVLKLAELERCRAIKWSTPGPSGELGASYAEAVSTFSDRLAVIDNQGQPVMVYLLGGVGRVTHLASIWPEHDLAICGLLASGRYAEAMERYEKVNWPWLNMRSKMYGRTGLESPVTKAALDMCGRPGGPSRLPNRALNEEERGELRNVLVEIGAPGF
jgi:4-hydroxy-tetrahydrodipicolinate synthase